MLLQKWIIKFYKCFHNKKDNSHFIGDPCRGNARVAPTANNTEKAAAYHRIADYKDKTNLNEAKRLYEQAIANNPNSAYAHNQLAKVERILNYKPLKMDYVEINGVKWATRNIGEPQNFWKIIFVARGLRLWRRQKW